MEAGQGIGTPELVAVKDLLQAAVEAVTPTAEGKEVVLAMTIARDLPEVKADPDMIKRVLINLIENSIKYSSEKQTVTVGAKRRGREVQFWVEDQGRGIPKTEHERIFEKFTRVTSGASGNTKGLGLGLAYCKLAVEGHGGEIWVESEEGKGARFIFTLPAA
jgi:signal transduction histidine kinase